MIQGLGQQDQPKVKSLQWLVVDPYQSMNAMSINSWFQDEDIKLLVKLKLQ